MANLRPHHRLSTVPLYGLLTISLTVAACAPSAAPGATAVSSPAAAQQVAKPEAKPTAQPTAKPAAATPVQGAAANPTEAPGLPAGVPPDWEKQWNTLLAAAKQEGKVVVLGSPDPAMRTMVPAAFQQRFGIEVEYTGASGTQIAARLQGERAAGVYAGDVMFSGADTLYRTIAADGKVTDGAMGMLAPLRPALLLPEVLDASKYRNGKLWFVDPQERYILRISDQVKLAGALNTDAVPLSALKTWDDLLKPEYKGKIAAFDPSVAGSGLAIGSFLYVMQGEEYIKRLYLGQDVFLTRDQRQLSDQVARGSYPIGLGMDAAEVNRLVQEGFKVSELTSLPGYLSGGFGLLALLDRAPHPNAAKVFANWLASREGSQLYQNAQKNLSTRNDVDVSSYPPAYVPQSNVKYMDTYEWNYVMGKRADAQDRLRDILSKR